LVQIPSKHILTLPTIGILASTTTTLLQKL